MTSADLYRLFGFGPLAALTNPPGPDVGGEVFLMRHVVFSINHQVGDGGWQSDILYTREEAERAAVILARFFCGAELVR